MVTHIRRISQTFEQNSSFVPKSKCLVQDSLSTLETLRTKPRSKSSETTSAPSDKSPTSESSATARPDVQEDSLSSSSLMRPELREPAINSTESTSTEDNSVSTLPPDKHFH